MRLQKIRYGEVAMISHFLTVVLYASLGSAEQVFNVHKLLVLGLLCLCCSFLLRDCLSPSSRSRLLQQTVSWGSLAQALQLYQFALLTFVGLCLCCICLRQELVEVTICVLLKRVAYFFVHLVVV